MDHRYRFTVFTPCYNSEAFLSRVLESLTRQTFSDFEWFVIDDASTDKTHEIISRFISSAGFPVTYLRRERNAGLLANYNHVIGEARGEFLVALGHDDEMAPDALETFDTVLKRHDSPEISAVYALAADQDGRLVGKKYPDDEMVSDYWTQFFALNNEAEKFQCFRTRYLREFYPIDTSAENGMPAAWLWGMLGAGYRAVFVNKVLRTYYTNVETSMTNTLKRGSNPVIICNYYLCWVNRFQYHIKGNRVRRLRGTGGYVSYGLLAGKSLRQLIKPVQSRINRMIVIFMFPVAGCYNLRQRQKEK